MYGGVLENRHSKFVNTTVDNPVDIIEMLLQK